MDSTCDDNAECNNSTDVKALVKRKSLSSQTTVNNAATSNSVEENSRHLQSAIRDVSAREVAIQANDYDIERTSSHLPARKRYIPLKFSDYRIFAGGSQMEEKEEEEEEDATFDPEKQVKKTLKVKSGRGRGRPRKNVVEGAKQDGPEKKTTITKVPAGFKCGICGRIFSLRGNAKAHLITHTDQKPYACDFEGCGKQMRTKESLRRHQLSHLGIKMFECSECQKKFSSNASLQEHVARHTGAKPLTCNVCGSKFRQVAVLKRHITTHSDDKPFACGICGKRFAMKVYVQSHMKIHTGERPFTCDTCHKSFAHASDLNRHKIIHTGKKPYACSVCSMRYTDASSRRRHEREHQSKQQYMCHLCNQHFTRAGQLRSHLMKEHNTEMETLFEVQVVDKGSQSDWSVDGGQPKLVNILHNIPPNIVVQHVNVMGQKGHTSDTLKDIEPPSASVQVLMGTSDLAQSSSDSKENTEAVSQVHDSKSIAVPETPASLEDLANLQAGCTFRIIGHDDSSQVYELQLEDGSQIPFEELANRISLGDIHLQANDASLTFIQREDNTYTIIQQSQTCDAGLEQPPERSIDSSDQWQVDSNTSQHLQNTHTHKSIQNVKEEFIAADTFTTSTAKTENVSVDSGEMTVNIYNTDTRDKLFDDNNTEKAHIPETWNLPVVTIEAPSSESPDYIYDPDFNSQDYYNWLSAFTAECKLLPMPLDKSTFQKISHVQKTLSDFMASPSGVISDRNNFKVLMSITHDLLDIIGKHLALMLHNLS